MADISPLLRIKLHAPTPPAQLVPRPRLVDRLRAAGAGQLSLIAAPAGFGKTTLIGEWLRECGQPIAWLSLDSGDDEPVRFWTYVIAAFQTHEATIGRGALSLLQSPPAPAIESILTTLLNDLLDCPPFVLVLDDYHVITNPAIHKAVDFLLDHLPPSLHLVITSRSEPPLALARLRARRLLNDIRAADLRFTPEEATQFFAHVADLNLTADDVTLLDERTEGWVTGLQLAALSMQSHGEKGAFLTAFTGQDRYVVDYLLEEVFQQQTPAVQTFLMQTAILDELSGPLCDAIRGHTEADSGESSQETLESLERANIFLVPLDNERRWYRYQQLFRDFLLGRLEQTRPESMSELHRAAAMWYRAQNLPEAAIDHALAGADIDQAVDLLLVMATPMLWERGEGLTVRRWLSALPPEIVDAQPRLSLDLIWAIFFTGEWGTIQEQLPKVEAALGVTVAELASDVTQLPQLSTDIQAMLGEVAAVSAELAIFHKSDQHALTLIELALRLITDDNPRLHSLLIQLKGFVFRLSGDGAQATAALMAATELAQRLGTLSTQIFSQCDLAEVQIMQGQLGHATKTFQDVMALAGEQGTWPLLPTGAAYIGMGELLYERNDLEAAAQHIERGMALCEQGGVYGYVRRGHLLLGQVYQAQGEVIQAGHALDAALAFVKKYDVPWRLGQTEAQIAQIRLRLGDIAAARAWAAQYVNRPTEGDTTPAYVTQQNDTVLARVQLAQVNVDHTLLDELIDRAEKSGWTRNLIQLLITRALFFAQQDQIARALTALTAALTAAEPEGYIRTFVDEGQPLAQLLRTASSRGVQPTYIGKLQAAFMPLTDQSPVIADGLFEPLTAREVKVLELMASGLSNREIADELIIAIGTVAKYSNNIFTKLNVRNRTQATQRAQALELI